ncbi:MAG: hypothetical protein IKN15_05865 [Bacteroidaceae bacterium]|nr:hypothetical protein [Bacteroidaceae bacterium]
MEKIKKDKRGGKREGAGRKKGVEAKKFLLNLELDLYEALKDVPNKTQYINYAIKFALQNDAAFKRFLATIRDKD